MEINGDRETKEIIYGIWFVEPSSTCTASDTLCPANRESEEYCLARMCAEVRIDEEGRKPRHLCSLLVMEQQRSVK